MRLKLLFANSFLMFTMILAILFGASAASGQTSNLQVVALEYKTS